MKLYNVAWAKLCGSNVISGSCVVIEESVDGAKISTWVHLKSEDSDSPILLEDLVVDDVSGSEFWAYLSTLPDDQLKSIKKYAGFTD